MSRAVLALGAVALSLSLVLPIQVANSYSQIQIEDSVVEKLDRAPQSPDRVIESDEFFQTALRSRGTERDNSQRIEALLKQMTLEEKVGQMTQLTMEMIVSGHDKNIQI